MSSLRYLQGKFMPKHPEKYVGDIHKIVFRSSYELAAFNFIDNQKDILKWSSEETIIPYTMGEGDRMRRYFVDLSILVRIDANTTKKFLIEIKPYGKTIAPKKTTKTSDKTYNSSLAEWIQNSAKWAAAEKFCERNNATFILWTERQIFPEFGKLAVKRIPRRKPPGKR